MRRILKLKPVRFVLAIVIVVVTVELALRLVGGLVQLYQSAGGGGGSITIVTLGESTTADLPIQGAISWPRQLAEILEKRGLDVKVRNHGRPATTSDQILARLPQILDSERPRIVISMMGINDTRLRLRTMGAIAGSRWWENLRVVKLLRVLESSATEEGFTPQAVQDLGPTDFPELDRTVEELRSNPAPAIERIEAFAKDKTPIERSRIFGYFGFRVFTGGKIPPAFWSTRHELLKRAVTSSVEDPKITEFAAITALRQGESATCTMIAEKYSNENVEPTSSVLSHLVACAPKDVIVDGLKARYLPASELARENLLSENYRSIVKGALASGACVIAMQYPTRPRSDLETMLTVPELQDQIGKRLFFAANEENFATVLESHGFDALFFDDFAGSFGHATPLGNSLVAKTAASAVSTALASPDCTH